MAAPHLPDSEMLAEACASRSLLIEPGRIYFGADDKPRNYFRLGFSSIEERKIEPGIKLLAEAIAVMQRHEPAQLSRR